MSRSTEEQDGAGRLGRPAGLPKRWSARRKAEVVLRRLRGEDIGEVSREIRAVRAVEDGGLAIPRHVADAILGHKEATLGFVRYTGRMRTRWREQPSPNSVEAPTSPALATAPSALVPRCLVALAVDGWHILAAPHIGQRCRNVGMDPIPALRAFLK